MSEGLVPDQFFLHANVKLPSVGDEFALDQPRTLADRTEATSYFCTMSYVQQRLTASTSSSEQDPRKLQKVALNLRVPDALGRSTSIMLR